MLHAPHETGQMLMILCPMLAFAHAPIEASSGHVHLVWPFLQPHSRPPRPQPKLPGLPAEVGSAQLPW